MPSFQWRRNGVNINDAISQDYTLVEADDQTSITVVYTFPDGTTTLTSQPVFVTFPTPLFTDQPNFTTANFNVGQNVIVNFNSFATEYPATVSLTRFTVDGVSFLGDVVDTGSAFTWNSTGYDVYGKDGLVEFEITATNSGGSVVSNRISSTLRDVPAQMTAPVATVVSGKTLSVDINDTVDDGNSPITSYDFRYSVNESTWTTINNFIDNSVINLPDYETQYYMQSRAINTVGEGAWSLSGTVITNSVPAAVIVITSVGVQSGGDIPLTYTINKNDPTVQAVTYAASLPNPTAADFTGENPDYTVQPTVSLTVTGDTIILPLVGLFNGDARLALLPTGGGSDDIAVSPVFSLAQTDNIAPTATSVEAGTQDGDNIPVTVLDLSENATAFWVLVPGGADAPSAAQIIAGEDADDAPASASGDFEATPTGGPFTADFGSLAGTFDLYVVFRDPSLNVSIVYSDTGIVITGPGVWDITAGDGTFTVNDFPAAPTAPPWDITAGDESFTINDYPGAP